MHPLASIGLTVALAVGPNGGGLLRSLPEPPDLPAAGLSEVAPRLWVVFHDVPDWTMAFYLPPAARPEDAAAASPPLGSPGGKVDLSLFVLAGSGRTERLLPRLAVPRLFLYSPYYRPGGSSPAVFSEMPLDVAESFASALLLAYFDLAPEALQRRFEERAVELMDDVEPLRRREAYLTALGDFGSELLSVAVELRRVLARQRAAGRDVCPAVDHPRTLFGQWRRILTDQEYRGYYAGADGLVFSEGALERSDKELLLVEVLGGSFTGDVRRDFALRCP